MDKNILINDEEDSLSLEDFLGLLFSLFYLNIYMIIKINNK